MYANRKLAGIAGLALAVITAAAPVQAQPERHGGGYRGGGYRAPANRAPAARSGFSGGRSFAPAPRFSGERGFSGGRSFTPARGFAPSVDERTRFAGANSNFNGERHEHEPDHREFHHGYRFHGRFDAVQPFTAYVGPAPILNPGAYPGYGEAISFYGTVQGIDFNSGTLDILADNGQTYDVPVNDPGDFGGGERVYVAGTNYNGTIQAVAVQPL